MKGGWGVYYFICNRVEEGYKTIVPFSNNWLMLSVYLFSASWKERCKGAFKNSCKEVCALPLGRLSVLFPAGCDLLISLYLAWTQPPLRVEPPGAVYPLRIGCRHPLLQRLDAIALWATSSPGQQLVKPCLCTESLLTSGTEWALHCRDKCGPWQDVVTPRAMQ